MKRRYAAMVLGMVLSVASVSVYATEATVTDVTVVEEASEAAEGDENTASLEGNQEAVENGEVLWGEVTSVEDGSITLLLGNLTAAGGPGEENAGQEIADGDAEQASEEAAEDGAEEAAEDGAEQTAEEAAEDGAEQASEETAEDGTEQTTNEVTENNNVQELPENGELPEGAPGTGVELAPNGEEYTVTVTDETPVYLVYGNTNMERIQVIADSLRNTELEDPAAAAQEAANALVAVPFELQESAENMDAEQVAEEAAENTDTEAEATEDVEAVEDAAGSEDIDGAADGSDVTGDTENLAEVSEGAENEMAADEEGAADGSSETVVSETTLDSILVGDLMGVLMDEEGAVSAVMIVLPEMEVVAEAE